MTPEQGLDMEALEAMVKRHGLHGVQQMIGSTFSDITGTLEAMIDQHGLLHVITGLSLVCGEKAEHLRANWQDDESAKVWDRHSHLLDRLARKISD